MVTLQTILDTHSPYAQLYKCIKDIAHTIPSFQLKFTSSNALHLGRSNVPPVSEVAAVYVNSGTPPVNVDILSTFFKKELTHLQKYLTHIPIQCVIHCFSHVVILDGLYVSY